MNSNECEAKRKFETINRKENNFWANVVEIWLTYLLSEALLPNCHHLKKWSNENYQASEPPGHSFIMVRNTDINKHFCLVQFLVIALHHQFPFGEKKN
jgi:hypothetical protein